MMQKILINNIFFKNWENEQKFGNKYSEKIKGSLLVKLLLLNNKKSFCCWKKKKKIPKSQVELNAYSFEEKILLSPVICDIE
jgi:hypothetical protein